MIRYLLFRKFDFFKIFLSCWMSMNNVTSKGQKGSANIKKWQ